MHAALDPQLQRLLARGQLGPPVSVHDAADPHLQPYPGCTVGHPISMHTLNCSFTKLADLGPLSACTMLHTLNCNYSQVVGLGPLSAVRCCRPSTAATADRCQTLALLQHAGGYEPSSADSAYVWQTWVPWQHTRVCRPSTAATAHWCQTFVPWQHARVCRPSTAATSHWCQPLHIDANHTE